MTLSFRSDATGGAILADGVEKIKFDSAGKVIVANDGSIFATGDFTMKMRASAPTGWVAGDGGTIGNVGSGATRANVDTLALFTLWWTDYSDALCPILTSAGAGSTRGASAAADWAALKRLTVFDVRDRHPRGAGSRIANGEKLEATRHYYDTLNDTTLRAAHAGSQPINPDQTFATDNINIIFAPGTNAGATANQTTASVRVSAIGMLPCFKL
jgi:hypothetical protein